MSAREALLARLIDDAGQFPPARRTLQDAASHFRAARKGRWKWLLGRFLCPASRLDEGTLPAPLGVVSDSDDFEADLDVAVTLGADAFELRDPGADAYPLLTGSPLRVFVEGSADLEALAAAGLGAKIRCGGLDASAFPTNAEVAAFIGECRRLRLIFKATAGLHHPFRVRDESLGVLQHGFVNLLAATILDVDDLEAVIAQRDAAAFTLDADGLEWNGVRADAAAIGRGRQLFMAFGSCAFDEPVEDLLAYGVLEAAHA